jgi:hypothetical protein
VREISGELATTSGLHLGQSPLEVQAILGKPDFASPDKLIYSRYVIKETPQEELEKIKAHSSMSAKQVEGVYGHFGLSIYIEARFAEDRLSYVAISNSESY